MKKWLKIVLIVILLLFLIGIIAGLMIVFVYLPVKENAGILGILNSVAPTPSITIPSALPAEGISASGKGWVKTIRGWGGDMEGCIQQTSDGGYITVANFNRTHTETFTGEIMNFSLIKMDKDGNILWTKIYKPDNPLFEYFTGCSVQQTTDGGYITAATVFPFKSINLSTRIPVIFFSEPSTDQIVAKIYLMKTDQNGNKLWERYIGEGYTTGRSVQQTPDGGYIILGWAPYAEGNIYLVKTDALGKMTWQKNFGGPKAQAYSFILTSDGGYAIAGMSEILLPIGTKIRIADGSEIPRGAQEDAYIVKTDANGNIIWEKKYAEKVDETWNAWSIQETSDDGYVVVGSMSSPNEVGSQYLRKIDGNGNLVREKMFPLQNYAAVFLHSVKQTSDGGYIIAGLFYFGDGNIRREHGYSKPYLLKTDKEWNTVWKKIYGEEFLVDIGFRSVKQTSDGGYIAAGYSWYGLNESRVESDIIIVKTDENGNT